MKKEMCMGTDDQIQFYRNLAVTRCGDAYAALVGEYGKEKTWDVVAEIAFYAINGELPEWGRYIERVEVVNGNLIYVHRAREVLQ